MLKREDIRIRDPFILTDTENGCYYMYGTTGLREGSYCTDGKWRVYKTKDLENFEEPKVIFDAAAYGYWAQDDFWAPEVHRYNGRYYLLGTVKTEGKCRATRIFVGDTPDGDFRPVSDAPITPPDWECLDGTLWVEDGVPYMIFCHEWLQVKDGEMWAVPLKDDLSAPAGEPFFLFRASENPDVSELGRRHPGCFVTDGPFLYSEDGILKMIWSSTCHGRYLVLEAWADSLRGPWRQQGNRFAFDGGHAMLFTDLSGRRRISLHSPNKTGLERPLFLDF